MWSPVGEDLSPSYFNVPESVVSASGPRVGIDGPAKVGTPERVYETPAWGFTKLSLCLVLLSPFKTVQAQVPSLGKEGQATQARKEPTNINILGGTLSGTNQICPWEKRGPVPGTGLFFCENFLDPCHLKGTLLLSSPIHARFFENFLVDVGGAPHFFKTSHCGPCRIGSP